MQTRLYNLWEKLRTSFWLVPALMVAFAICVFLLLLNLDREQQNSAFLFLSFLDPISASGARIVLSTIAGSMITVAGTVFSITIVTLTLASTQFGPRLLRNFMQSTVNKVVLGSFISTFVYCLCVLGSVEPAGRESFVPGLSVNFAVILALFNVAILIYFIHHVARSIQVETVIHNINCDLIKNIENFFSEKSESNEGEALSLVRSDSSSKNSKEDNEIVAWEHGYLQAIDKDALRKFACENEVSLTLIQRQGDYITRGMPLVAVGRNQSFSEEACTTLRKAFLLGAQRTSEQDVEYSIHQLVEIAVRALSPGVNDPFTALGCIDYLGSVICRIMERDFPAEHLFGEDDEVLVTLKVVSFSGIVRAAFDQIRQHGSNDAAILIRLLEVLCNAIKLTEDSEQEKILLRQAEMVHRAGSKNLPEEHDRNDLDERFETILQFFPTVKKTVND